MSKISFDPSKDTLIHVGDLIAKGDKNEEVLQWMIKHSIQGVRGNHDQPVSWTTANEYISDVIRSSNGVRGWSGPAGTTGRAMSTSWRIK